MKMVGAFLDGISGFQFEARCTFNCVCVKKVTQSSHNLSLLKIHIRYWVALFRATYLKNILLLLTATILTAHSKGCVAIILLPATMLTAHYKDV